MVPPQDEIPQAAIGQWIAEREALWRQLEDAAYGPLAIDGVLYQPFDAGAINRVLRTRGLLYGAGLGIYMKPSFFLADLVSSRRCGGLDVFVAGREYARDLSAHAAMLQGETIFARREALATMLWERLAEALHARFRGPLGYAFSSYGVNPDEAATRPQRLPEGIIDEEIETFIAHEIGEAVEGKRLGEAWKTILAGAQDRRAEAFYRGVKDILADTSGQGMLRHIIDERKRGSLGFYRASLGGYALLIFPELKDAFESIRRDDDWQEVERARRTAYVRATGLAGRVMEIHEVAGEAAEERVVRELVGPLQVRA